VSRARRARARAHARDAFADARRSFLQSKKSVEGRRAAYFARRRREEEQEQATHGGGGEDGGGGGGATTQYYDEDGALLESYDILKLRFLAELAPAVSEQAASELNTGGGGVARGARPALSITALDDAAEDESEVAAAPQLALPARSHSSGGGGHARRGGSSGLSGGSGGDYAAPAAAPALRRLLALMPPPTAAAFAAAPARGARVAAAPQAG
jgi:hypothetical protein